MNPIYMAQAAADDVVSNGGVVADFSAETWWLTLIKAVTPSPARAWPIRVTPSTPCPPSHPQPATPSGLAAGTAWASCSPR